MFRIGKAFGFPVAANVVKFSMKDNKVTVESEREGGIRDAYELPLPCVLGAGRGLNTPEYPTFPQIVKARKKQIKKIDFNTLGIEKTGAAMEVIELKPFVKKRCPVEIKGTPLEAAEKLAKILHEEAKVI